MSPWSEAKGAGAQPELRPVLFLLAPLGDSLLVTSHLLLLTSHFQWQEQLCAATPSPAGAFTTGSDLLGSSMGRSPA
jgi:hypothetical protein